MWRSTFGRLPAASELATKHAPLPPPPPRLLLNGQPRRARMRVPPPPGAQSMHQAPQPSRLAHVGMAAERRTHERQTAKDFFG